MLEAEGDDVIVGEDEDQGGQIDDFDAAQSTLHTRPPDVEPAGEFLLNDDPPPLSNSAPVEPATHYRRRLSTKGRSDQPPERPE